MILSEKIEANANIVLWCVHVIGPDDVCAAPSHDAAVAHAHELNKKLHGRKGTPDDILCFAYAAPWPHSPESHVEALKAWPNPSPSPDSVSAALRDGSEASWRQQPGPWAHLTKEQTDELIAASVVRARAEVIEECAKIVESFDISYGTHLEASTALVVSSGIASAIRSRLPPASGEE